MADIREEFHYLFSAPLHPEVDSGDREPADVVNFIKGFNVPAITETANVYKDASSAVGEAQERLLQEARKLEKVWDGEASVEAQTALAILYVTMGELADKLDKLHGPAISLADVVRKHQAFMDDPGEPPGEWSDERFTWAAPEYNDQDDVYPSRYRTYTGYFDIDGNVVNEQVGKEGTRSALAGDHLRAFSADLLQIYLAFPNRIKKALCDIAPPEPDQGDLPQVTYPTGHTGGYASPSYDSVGLNGGRSSANTPRGPNLGAYDPSTGFANPPGSDANGSPPPTTEPPESTTEGSTDPATPTYPDVDTPPSAPDTSVTSGNGPDPSTSLADYQPTTPGYSPPSSTTTAYNTPTHNTPALSIPATSPTPGTYGGTGGGGLVPGQPASIGTRAGSGFGNSMPLLPMGGMGGAGGGGGESRDRETTAWLDEDDDVWGDDTGSVSNLIG